MRIDVRILIAFFGLLLVLGLAEISHAASKTSPTQPSQLARPSPTMSATQGRVREGKPTRRPRRPGNKKLVLAEVEIEDEEEQGRARPALLALALLPPDLLPSLHKVHPFALRTPRPPARLPLHLALHVLLL